MGGPSRRLVAAHHSGTAWQLESTHPFIGFSSHAPSRRPHWKPCARARAEPRAVRGRTAGDGSPSHWRSRARRSLIFKLSTPSGRRVCSSSPRIRVALVRAGVRLQCWCAGEHGGHDRPWPGLGRAGPGPASNRSRAHGPDWPGPREPTPPVLHALRSAKAAHARVLSYATPASTRPGRLGSRPACVRPAPPTATAQWSRPGRSYPEGGMAPRPRCQKPPGKSGTGPVISPVLDAGPSLCRPIGRDSEEPALRGSKVTVRHWRPGPRTALDWTACLRASESGF